jgi:endonuclease/exonuclease/phosphatase family metal-dependent hydrolase
MQTRKSCLIFTAAIILLGTAQLAAEPVRVMTFNIRFGTAPDGENAWPLRRDLVAKVIADEKPDVVGVQEALRSQLDELAEALPEYGRIGVGREPAGGGEYSAILYRTARFDVCDAGTFWLSEAPEEPGSKTWGNNLPRICTWARLLDRTNDRRFVLLNTHWDHESQPARLESGKLMARRIGDICTDGEPAIVTGDFNAAPDNPAIRALVDEGCVKDTFTTIHPDEKRVGTFNGFGTKRNSPKIDAILTTDHWKVEDAAIVRTHEGKRYPSDHFPVTATVTLSEDDSTDSSSAR